MSKKVSHKSPNYWGYTTDTISNRYFRYLKISKIFHVFCWKNSIYISHSLSHLNFRCDMIFKISKPWDIDPLTKPCGLLGPLGPWNGSSLVYWLTPWTLLQGKNSWDLGFFPRKTDGFLLFLFFYLAMLTRRIANKTRM